MCGCIICVCLYLCALVIWDRKRKAARGTSECWQLLRLTNSSTQKMKMKKNGKLRPGCSSNTYTPTCTPTHTQLGKWLAKWMRICEDGYAGFGHSPRGCVDRRLLWTCGKCICCVQQAVTLTASGGHLLVYFQLSVSSLPSSPTLYSHLAFMSCARV